MSFSCLDDKSEEPILVINMTTICLKCDDCFESINNYIGEFWYIITEVWGANFGCYRANVINDVGRLSFIVEKKIKKVNLK